MKSDFLPKPTGAASHRTHVFGGVDSLVPHPSQESPFALLNQSPALWEKGSSVGKGTLPWDTEIVQVK